MKLEKNKKYFTIAVYCFLVLAAVALFLIALLNFGALKNAAGTVIRSISPLLYGITIAYLINPLMVTFETRVFRFEKQTKGTNRLRRGLSLTLAMLIVLACLVFFFWFFFNNVYDSYQMLVSRLNDYLASLDKLLEKFKFSSIIGDQFENLQGLIGLNTEGKQAGLFGDLADLIVNVSPAVFNFAAGFVKEIVNILVGAILAVYLLCFRERTLAQLKKGLTAVLRSDHLAQVYRVARITDDNIGGFIRGKLLDSLIIGVLTYFVLWIFGIPYYPVLSVIIGVTNFIPFFGPFIGAIPSAFIVLIAEPSKVIWFILIILIIQQLDGNVIGNIILSGHMRLSALWVSIAIIVMGGLFGFLGMLIGVPVFAVIYTLIAERVNKRLTEKGLSTATVDYAPAGSYAPPTDPPEKKRSFLIKPSRFLEKQKEKRRVKKDQKKKS